MKPGDLDGKPYAKYWRPEMRGLQPQVSKAVIHGPEAGDLGFPLSEVDRMMEPGYLPLENGYTQMESGDTLVAVLTEMPGVTGDMIEWWLGWHTQEHQRYKLWDPRAHMANGTKEMAGDDPNVTDRQKYMTTHYVTEYIGDQLEDIYINFVEPSTLFKTSDLNANGVQVMACAWVSLQRAPVIIGRIVHQLRDSPDGGGAELRSRFWLKPEALNGNALANRFLGSQWFRNRIVAGNLGHNMLVHCGMEMNQLAGFLPDLYRDYHPRLN